MKLSNSFTTALIWPFPRTSRLAARAAARATRTADGRHADGSERLRCKRGWRHDELATGDALCPGTVAGAPVDAFGCSAERRAAGVETQDL
jgi:hypothetical protein